MNTLRMALMVLGWCVAAVSQPSSGPRFEVASIKSSNSGASPDVIRRQGGPGGNDPGRIIYHNYPIRDLIKEAYQVLGVQLSAPAWLMSVDIIDKADTFEVEAKYPVETTKEQYRLMLQNFLVERFGLKVHRETRQGPVYELRVNRDGPKLLPLPEQHQETATDDHHNIPSMLLEPVSIQLGPRGEDGFATTPEDYSGFLTGINPANNHVRYKFIRTTMAEFANWLWWKIRAKPVIDVTGLKGKYNFYLEHVNGMPKSDEASSGGETLFDALQKQLGLRLVSGKGDYEVLVVDHVERMPSAN